VFGVEGWEGWEGWVRFGSFEAATAPSSSSRPLPNLDGLLADPFTIPLAYGRDVDRIQWRRKVAHLTC